MLGTRPLGWLDISLSVSLFLFFSFWCIQHLVDKVKALIRTKFPYLLLWSLFRTAVNNAVAHSFHSIQMTIWDICNINIYIKHYPLSSWLRIKSLCLPEMWHLGILTILSWGIFFFFFFVMILIPLLSTVLIWTGLQAAGSTELQVHFR